MCRQVKLTVALLNAIFILTASLGSTPLCAEDIAIVNPSFEAQVLSDGWWVDGTLTGWSVDGYFAGPQNWTDTEYPGATDGDGVTSTVPDGRNSAFIRVSDISISQSLGATLQPNTDYTLDYFIGHRGNGWFPSYRAELMAGNNVLAVDDTSVTPNPGQWLPSSTTFSVDASNPYLGEQVGIRFTAYGAEDPSGMPGIYQVHVDDVRLKAMQKPQGPKTHAVLIGSRAPLFGSSGPIADGLRGDLDVQNMEAALSWADDVRTLIYTYSDSDTLGSDLQRELSEMEFKSGDQLIVYYSGHGSWTTGNPVTDAANYHLYGERAALTLGVDETINPVEHGSMTDDTLRNILADESLDDVSKVVFLDSCHGGGFIGGDGPGSQDLSDIDNLALFAAAGEGAVAYCAPDGTGVWTNSLLPLLDGGLTYAELSGISAVSYNGIIDGNVKSPYGGSGPGTVEAFSYFSESFDEGARVNVAVPEPSALVTMFAGILVFLVYRGQKRMLGVPLSSF